MNTLSSLLNFIGGKIQEYDTPTPIVYRKSFTYEFSGSLAAGAQRVISGNDLGYEIPDGYTLVGIRGVYSNSTGIDVVGMRLASGVAQSIKVRNGGTVTVTTFILYLTAVFMKSEYVTDSI